MELYQALQVVLDKIRDNNEATGYGSDDKDKLYCIMGNQERIGEALLVLGSVLQVLIEKEIAVQLVPAKDESKH